MAKIYAGSTGELLRVNHDGSMDAARPTAPEGAVYSLTFDEDSNAQLIAALRANPQDFRLIGTALTRKGTSIVIAPDSADTLIRKQIGIIWPKLRSRTATNAEIQAALVFIGRILKDAGLVDL